MRARPLVTIAIAWAFLVVPARAQEQEVRTIPFDGPEIVCHILDGLGMKPIKTLEEAADDPVQTVIIVFGNPHVIAELQTATGGLKQYLNAGGSLLIATDRPLTMRNLGIHVSGTLVNVPDKLKEWHAYNEEMKCPLLRSSAQLARPRTKVDRGDPPRFWQTEIAGRDHPLFSFLQKGIATNCPSYIAVLERDPSLRDLLIFPFDEFAGRNFQRGPLCYMVGSPRDAPPHGRALYIAGHGMFMNGMMAQTDSDNFDFTVNAVRWLREGPKGATRTRALFVVDGTIITDFDMKLTSPVRPIPVPPVKMLNRLIRGLENERFFHRLLEDLLGDWRGRLIGILLGLVTFGVLLYGAKKFLAGRHHIETAVPALLGPQPAPASSAPSQQRQQAMLRQREFWEVSRQLVLDWFRQEFDVTPDRWRADVDARFHVEEPFWSRWSLQRRANEMLRLARSAAPVTVSRHQFFVLVETLKELSGALKDGRLALLVEGKNVRQS
jgi:hypothetical protein